MRYTVYLPVDPLRVVSRSVYTRVQWLKVDTTEPTFPDTVSSSPQSSNQQSEKSAAWSHLGLVMRGGAVG